MVRSAEHLEHAQAGELDAHQQGNPDDYHTRHVDQESVDHGLPAQEPAGPKDGETKVPLGDENGTGDRSPRQRDRNYGNLSLN